MAKTSKLLTTLQERMDWKIGGKSAVGQVWGGIALGLLFAVMGSYRKIKEIYETTKPEHYSVERL